MTFSFHALMTLTNATALVLVSRRPSPQVGWAALAAIGGVSAVLASALGLGPFGALHLLSFGVFFYAPVFLFVAAVFLSRRHRRIAFAMVALGVLVVGVGVDAFLIEPTWLEVTRHEIRSPLLEKKVRVVVLSDFQTDTFGDYERRVLDTVMEQKPDLILLTGDYVQIYRQPERWDAVTSEIRGYMARIRFGAPLGALAVRGDVDLNAWERLFHGLPVKTFNHTEGVRLPNGIFVTALAQPDSRNRDLHIARHPNKFHIVFGHAPDFALADVPANLLVAGHTHGGQVRLPGIGPLLTFSGIPRSWAAGRTDLGGGRVLVVSRGTGMERHVAPRMRFLCRPEVVVLDLLPEA